MIDIHEGLQGETPNASRWNALQQTLYAHPKRYAQFAKGQCTGIRHKSRIVWTAPHAVAHIREGKRKSIDLNTGGLALALATATTSSCLVPTNLHTTDPNWVGTQSPFFTVLAQWIQRGSFVLDLHGMKDDYGCDVCIALGAYPSPVALQFARYMEQTAVQFGITVKVNAPFDAKRDSTITGSVQLLGIDALEIEIARRFREPSLYPDAAERLMQWLTLCAKNLQ